MSQDNNCGIGKRNQCSQEYRDWIKTVETALGVDLPDCADIKPYGGYAHAIKASEFDPVTSSAEIVEVDQNWSAFRNPCFVTRLSGRKVNGQWEVTQNNTTTQLCDDETMERAREIINRRIDPDSSSREGLDFDLYNEIYGQGCRGFFAERSGNFEPYTRIEHISDGGRQVYRSAIYSALNGGNLTEAMTLVSLHIGDHLRVGVQNAGEQKARAGIVKKDLDAMDDLVIAGHVVSTSGNVDEAVATREAREHLEKWVEEIQKPNPDKSIIAGEIDAILRALASSRSYVSRFFRTEVLKVLHWPDF